MNLKGKYFLNLYRKGTTKKVQSAKCLPGQTDVKKHQMWLQVTVLPAMMMQTGGSPGLDGHLVMSITDLQVHGKFLSQKLKGSAIEKDN